jgi:hypothetical protein
MREFLPVLLRAGVLGVHLPPTALKTAGEEFLISPQGRHCPYYIFLANV